MNRQFFFGIVLAAIFGATATLGAGQTGDAVLAGRVSEAGSGKPLAGIRVTNGSDVVLTGADGRYQLPRHPGLRTRFVSVVVPGNFSCETRYRPAAEGGGDFVLAPRPRRSGFTFIHVGDTETTKYDRHLNEIMAYARNTGAAFIIHTGDLSDFGLTKEFVWQRTILNGFKMPWVCIIGNHDCLGTGEDVYHTIFGDDNFSFNASFVHITCINTNAFEYDYSAAVPDFNFIKQDLAAVPDTISHSVVAMHAKPGSEQFNNNVLDYFDYMLNKYPGLSFCIIGHDHHTEVFYPFENGVPYYECGSAKTRTYIVYTITRESYTYEAVKI